MTVMDTEGKQYVTTIQRKEGKTPHQKAVEAELALAEAELRHEQEIEAFRKVMELAHKKGF